MDSMKVIIVTGVGEYTMDVGAREPVLAMKQNIEQYLGVQVANQTLSVYEIELIDGLDMEDYPFISEGTRIELTVGSMEATVQERVNIVLKFPTTARWMNIDVDRAETVKTLKEKIHIIDATPIQRITLLFSGIEMKEDHRFLSEYGICEQSEITVIHTNAASLRAEPTSRVVSFMVQTAASLLNSAIIPVEMKDSCTIEELRNSLLDERILPRDDYFFIHKQRIMQDSCSLRWHGVENGDFLLVFKGTVTRADT